VSPLHTLLEGTAKNVGTQPVAAIADVVGLRIQLGEIVLTRERSRVPLIAPGARDYVVKLAR
jgi:hypothetical protein